MHDPLYARALAIECGGCCAGRRDARSRIDYGLLLLDCVYGACSVRAPPGDGRRRSTEETGCMDVGEHSAEYGSEIAPPAEAGKDTLGDVITACRPLGIRVHAWFVFNQDKAYTDAHPEDRIWHHGKANTEFRPYEIDDGRVCPASVAHLEYMNSLIREVIERYSVDGIHLDCIRYGHMVYCFCPAHIEKAAKLGINVDKVRGVMFETL